MAKERTDEAGERTLRAAIDAEGRLPWPAAARVVARVAAALAAGQSSDPPARDGAIGAGRVVLRADGSVALQAARGGGGGPGDLAYLAPEQLEGRAVDHRADHFALGVLLHEAIAGAPPFASPSPRRAVELACTAAPPDLPPEVAATLPKAVDELRLALLEKAPEDRPYLAADVVERLAPFLPAAPPRAATEPAAPPRAATEPAAPPRAATEPAAPPRAATEPAAPPSAPPSAPPPGPAAAPAAAEVPTATAVAIIAGLSLAAGIAAYCARARAPEPEPPWPALVAPARAR